MREEPAILLVTCCLEETRYKIARRVIDNIVDDCPYSWRRQLTVFDNASTYLGLGELCTTFSNVVQADHNVGYWTAIDWWLDSLKADPPKYTYIIESDMIHYGAYDMGKCVRFLDEHPELGSVRLHEYWVAKRHLYDKDNPRHDSRRNLWQSHTNRVTGQPIVHQQVDRDLYRTNFLTQLPALNRYSTMMECFDDLRQRAKFAEPDFQAMYHARYPEIAILDGGMFNCDLNPYGTDVVTGSWTDAEALKRLGYQSTRHASIVSRDQYTVTRVR